jgi:hypothetical protein
MIKRINKNNMLMRRKNCSFASVKRLKKLMEILVPVAKSGHNQLLQIPDQKIPRKAY